MFFSRKASGFSPEKYGPVDRLILYHSESCFYCVFVRRAIERLGVQVELRNIYADPLFRQELFQARGRTTVPVLRGLSEENDWWMPESRDIVQYLEEKFGQKT